jgi:hypothetical protein
MSATRALHYYGYVERPYTKVRELLRGEPLELLQGATNSAAERAGAIAARLRLELGGFDIGVDVRPNVESIRDDEEVAGLAPVTRLTLGWEASRAPALFPSMHLELSAWPLAPDETQLEVRGEYRPPLGTLGHAFDIALGHRIAEASVHRLLDDIVEQLERDLPVDAPTSPSPPRADRAARPLAAGTSSTRR